MKRNKPPQEPVTLPDEIWGVEQAMRYLKCGRTKLYELIASGLPSLKIQGSRCFDPRDIAAWWDKQKRSA